MNQAAASITSATAQDGVRLHVEVTGTGCPVLFIHEFGGDHRSWEPQVRYFGRLYQCVTYAARGYPPSQVPADPAAYNSQLAVADALAVLDEIGAERAHVVGLSMGGFTALHLAMNHAQRVGTAVAAACGWGSQPGRTEQFRAESNRIADAFENEGPGQVSRRYAEGPARVQLQAKDPRGWREFRDQLSQHDGRGAALTMRGVQAARTPLYALADDLAAIQCPVLVVTGDEDDGCLEPGLFLKRTIPAAGLAVLPRTGHTCNLEEPAAFNRVLEDFFHAAEQGRWPRRDPRSQLDSFTGIDTAKHG
jgi:pimeloyl-ACP methyl ester carboxylesterase